jgi:ferredoxin
MTMVRVLPEQCTGCGECVSSCPVAAIEMREIGRASCRERV